MPATTPAASINSTAMKTLILIVILAAATLLIFKVEERKLIIQTIAEEGTEHITQFSPTVQPITNHNN